MEHMKNDIDQKEIEQLEQRKGFQPFYICPLLYIASFYLIPVVYSIVQEGSGASCILCLPIVFGVLNIIVSVKFCKEENRIMLLNAAVLVKYAMIPFFIIGGLIVAVSFMMAFMPVPFMIFLGPMAAAMEVVAGWLILAFASPYTICYLYLDSKVNIRSRFMTAIHIILQFSFTLDVIDVMYLTLKEHKWKKLTIFFIILLAIGAILLLLLIILGIVRLLN